MFIPFMAAATVFNVLVTAVCFVILSLLYMVFLIPYINEEMAFLGFSFLFVVSLVLSFFIYQRALKLYLKKWPLPGQQEFK